MSMTKRHLESLPQAEQDAILGGIDNAYISPDEWTDDTENEPICECGHGKYIHTPSGCDSLYCRCNGFARKNEPEDAAQEWFDARFSSRLADMAEEAELEWARTLMEEDDAPVDAEDEELDDPLVKCCVCRGTWPTSEMNTNGECPACQLEERERREMAPLVRPEGPCVTLESNGVVWKV